MKDLFTIKANIKALTFLIGIYFFWNLVAGTMGYFMPYIYETVGGLTPAEANLLQGVLWTFTVISTYVVFVKLGDKVNRKLLFSIGAVMGIVAWLVLTLGEWESLSSGYSLHYGELRQALVHKHFMHYLQASFFTPSTVRKRKVSCSA